MASNPVPSRTDRASLATSVECMGCGSDITPRGKRTYALCRTCEDKTGFEPFERGQQVKVPDDWQGEDGNDLAGCVGFITGRFSSGAFEVALRPEGWHATQPFALYENEIEAL